MSGGNGRNWIGVSFRSQFIGVSRGEALEEQGRRLRRHEGIQLQLRRWAEGDARGLLHGALGGW